MNTTINASVPASFSGNIREVEESLDSLNRNRFWTDDQLEEILDLFSKDVRAFERKARLYAAQAVINCLARRNASSVQIFYDRIHICGYVGKQICQDLLQAMKHTCQEDGKHEVLSKSFFLVRKDKDTKKTTFSFKDVKNNVWTSCLKWAKSHKQTLLYERLDAPKKSSTPTYLDRLVQIAEAYDKARSKATEGKESTAEASRLEAFNRQLQALPEGVREEVKNAIRVLSSVELPN